MQDNQTAPFPPPPPMYQRPRRSRWWIPVVIILGVIVLFFAALAGFVGLVVSKLETKHKDVSVRDNTVLLLDLSGGLEEYKAPMTLNFGDKGHGTSLFEILTAIEHAKTDDHIKGIYYRAGGAGFGMAKLNELRDALVDFRSSGKFVYAFIESGSKAHYYLASAADSIFMPQEGMLELNAFGASAPFMKGMFDKIGVEWHVQQFEEYKSAAESMTRSNWSAPAKEEVRALIDQRASMFVSAVAQGRHLSEEKVRATLDRGLYTADSAKAQGFIDRIVMENDLRTDIARRLNPKDSSDEPSLRLVSVANYDGVEDHDNSSVDKNNTIAIVYASGAIYAGKNDNPFEQENIYAKNLIKELKKAREDDDVTAIILRIDSPGGSVIGSEEIWAEIIKTRKVKPVYASMSDVAASGGYYIAMACDTIVAHPATITGSIGVILAIPNVAGTMDKIGVTIDTVSTGSSSQFMNPMMKFSEADKTTLHDLSAPIYRRFVQRVADARKKSFEETRLVSRGRVWTGEAAKKAGLVDVSGGLQTTIDMVKKRLGVPAGKKVNIISFPEEIDNLAALLKMFGVDDGSSDDDEETQASQKASVRQLLAGLTSSATPIEQVWKTLPYPVQQQLFHAARLTDIGMHEHTMVMMPTTVSVD